MIRQIAAEDYTDIIHILKKTNLQLEKLSDISYRLQIQEAGFLLPGFPTEEKFHQDVKKIHLVYEHEGKIVAFLRIDEEQEMEDADNVSWFRPELREAYFAKPHADIGGIAVLPEFAKRGIATALLDVAVSELRRLNREYLFSFVVLSPITNMSSILFHEKNGFFRVAVSSPHTLFGMEGYQSFLYAKKL